MSLRPFVFALVGAACLAATWVSTAQAVTFKWANDGDVRAMDPYTFDETVQNSFLANIYEPLVRRNKQLQPEPALATSWEQTSPTVWRFHLRPGVKFQDGTPFKASDVVFSFKRISSKTSGLSPEVASIKEIRAVDDLTVDVETKGPDPILPTEIVAMVIMSEAWCVKNNSVEPAIIGTSENFALRNAMGTGPYRLTAREPDRRNVLDRNTGWWDKPEGNVDHVEFTVIGSAPTRVAALLTGEMDMIYSVPTQDMERIAHTPGVRLIQSPELRTIYLGMDQARPELQFSNVKGKNPFKDLRVRQAFALAIDENAIAQRVMRGNARPTWEMWGPGINGFNPAMNTRPTVDLAKSKALLAEAGYPNGFEVTMDCPNDRYVNDEAICTAVSAMMARVGVKVNVYARTKVKFFADTGYPNYNTSFYLLGWTPGTYDAENVFQSLLHSRGPGVGLTNTGGISDPRLDDLTAKIAVELDAKKRQAMINDGIKIVQDNVYTIPLHQQTIVWAAKDNVQLTQPADNNFPMRWVTVK
jgi:peptide/nickel transport system substrate-binding protein